MNKLSTKEIIYMMILYILTSSIMTGYTYFNTEHPINLLISFIFALIPVIVSIYPIKSKETNLYEIIKQNFNKFFAKIIYLIFIVYAIIIEVFQLKYFVIFTKINILVKTPMIITTIIFLLLVFLMLKKNIVTLAKLSSFLIPFIILFIFFGMFFAIKMFDINNLQSLFTVDINNIYDNIILNATLPFSDIILFAFFMDNINKKSDIKKSYLIGISVSFIIITLIYFTNILVLGLPLLLKIPFPTFVTVGLSSIGTYITRVEVIVAFNLFITTLIKISLCTFTALLGLKHLMELNDIKEIGVIYSIIIFFATLFIPPTTDKLITTIGHFKYFFLFTAFILPIIILLKTKINKKTEP